MRAKGASPAFRGSRASVARALLAACLAGGLAGCAVGPNFVPPEPPKVDHYAEGADPTSTAEAEGQAQRLERGAQVFGDWWTLFGSAQLDALMKRAASDNETVKAALASLRSSQANLRAGYGIFYPQADANATAARQRITLVRFGQSNAQPTIFNLFSLSGTISYALDIFGGQRRAVESLQAQADYQTYTAAATYLTLTANVVNTVIARAAYGEEAQATQDIVRDQRDQVIITEAQAEAGTAPYASALSLRSQLAAVEATVPALLQRVSQAEHLLATLAGHLPSEWTAPQVAFSDLKLPDSVPVSLPSDLVHQRPDILAAEAQLHQASAEIGVATAALFPSINLTASLGGNNTTLDTLFAPNGTFWSIGAGLAAPLFHGGTLLNKRQAAIDAYDQALAAYRQSVLASFSQVADVLRALEHDAEILDAQARSMTAAEEALRLVRANYEAGVANYVQVLIAFGQYHQARIGYIEASAQRLQDTVALFVALGGGWWDSGRSLLAETSAAPKEPEHGAKAQ
ncbi:MAG TPA: efflux transporter outer membrane subunit [Thermoanaerobaculia bacterium]|nr:efflux transporter outer membrane subunit [Thermoanaerobaculia bacterium]